MSRAPARDAVALALTLVAALVAGFRLSGLGFYDDDWAWMALMSRAPDPSWLGGAVHFAEANAGVWARPLNYPLFPGLFRLFGADPLPYHLLLAGLQAWGGLALWRWLEEEELDRETAALAGGLFLLWPNHDATRHWVSLLTSPLALALTLEALRLRRRRPALGFLALLSGGLLYEAASPLALLPALLEAWRARRAGAAAAAAAGLRAGAWLLGALVALLLWQRVLCPLWLHPQRHPLTPSLWHGFQVFWNGVECQLLNRLWHLLGRQALWAAAAFGAAAWLAWAAAAAFLGWLARQALSARRPAGNALALAAALFILGYAPYLLDSAYSPVVFSVSNRVNLVPALGAALAAAWGLRRLGAAAHAALRRSAVGLAGASCAVLLLADWSSNAQWAEASRRQEEILSELQPRLDELPAGRKTLLLFGFASAVGSAPVFNSSYDLNGALSLSRGDPGLQALVAEGRMSFGEREAALRWFGDTPVPYAGLYAWHHARGEFARLPDRATAERFLRP